jgi:hypothetical protein
VVDELFEFCAKEVNANAAIAITTREITVKTTPVFFIR